MIKMSQKNWEKEFIHAGSFKRSLMLAIQRADTDNLARLAMGFPEMVKAYSDWMEGIGLSNPAGKAEKCDIYKGQGTYWNEFYYKDLPCPKCGKAEEGKMIEKIHREDVICCDYGDTDRVINYILILTNKINELIDYLNKDNPAEEDVDLEEVLPKSKQIRYEDNHRMMGLDGKIITTHTSIRYDREDEAYSQALQDVRTALQGYKIVRR